MYLRSPETCWGIHGRVCSCQRSINSPSDFGIIYQLVGCCLHIYSNTEKGLPQLGNSAQNMGRKLRAGIVSAEELGGISKPRLGVSLHPLYCCCPFSIFYFLLVRRREISGTERRKKRKTRCVAYSYRLSEILLLPLIFLLPVHSNTWMAAQEASSSS